MFWNFSEFFGIFRNVLEFFQISDWNFRECWGRMFGILWNVLEFSGMLESNVLEFYGMFWNVRE